MSAWRSVPIWDLPVRLFHWLLILLIAFQLYSGKAGGNAIAWHVISGYAVFVLVAFRVLWGFVGGTHARFANFLAGPSSVRRYARRLLSSESSAWPGHNPLGGWMVLAMLLVLAIQIGTGLFANDDIATEGPFAAFVSKNTSDRLTTLHRWNLALLLALASLHVLAVLYHRFIKKEDLIEAMITGRKRLSHAEAAAAESARGGSLWRASFLLAAVVGVVTLLVNRPF